MKKIILYICLSCFAFSAYSCKDWLDISPKSEVVEDDMFKKEAGFRDALMGVYTAMCESTMYGAFETQLMECFAGLITTSSYYTTPYFNIDLESVSVRNSFANMWLRHYYCIANLNELLVQIDKADPGLFSEGVKELLTGEALALRAFLHFDLVRMWGPVPVSANMQRQTVPYYTSVTVNAREPETLENVLKRIVDDLTAAREILKNHDPILLDDYAYSDYLDGTSGVGDGYANEGFFLFRSYRMNYYAATACLARVYHYAGQMSQAATYAKEVIYSEKFPLVTEQFRGAFIYWKMEYIFQLDKYDIETTIANRYYLANGGSADGTNNNLPHNRSVIFAGAALTNDWRANNLFHLPGTTYYLSKFNTRGSLPMFKVSEMYLIASEAENDFSYLNDYRVHRGYEGIRFQNGVDDMATEIELEYMREFLGEGQAYYYYKRLGKSPLLVKPALDHTLLFDLEYPDSELEHGYVTPKGLPNTED